MNKTYQQGVRDCMAIMSDLYDIHGDYSVAQDMYFAFSKRAKTLLK